MEESTINYGFLSILPPVIAIVIAIWRKQVYLSLLFGIWLGWLIINNGHVWDSIISTVGALVDVFQSKGNTRTIMFSALVGALILLVQKSGGVQGFVKMMDKMLNKLEHRSDSGKRKLVQLMAWATGIIIFVETSISSLTVGTIFRPVFDKLKIPREKLAYIADSSSAPTSILIPLNAWGAFIMGQLFLVGFTNPLNVLFKSMIFNFYPILALIMVPILILTGKDFGPMLKAERRTRKTGKLMNDGAKPLVSDELIKAKPIKGVKHKAYNMFIPILTMVFMMPFMLTYTGWDKGQETLAKYDKAPTTINKLLYAMENGSGSTSVLMAVIISLFIAYILYRSQKIIKTNQMVDLTLKGISELMPLALLMMMAFAIGAVTVQLHTGQYVADVAKEWLTPAFVPFIVFVISGFIAFATGTSWGTFAIMIPIAVPMAQAMDADVYMSIAAALGGGVFGDHSSPISDTTIISSMASASDHIDHVKTQLPYALTAGGIAALFYLIIGLIG
jgi:Na+/H+ antiporter NhaC